MQVRLRIEYDGTTYSGWQWQSGQDSIQAQIEAALERIFSAKVRVHAAGRTDAGVHALGQVAAFVPPRPFDPAELRRALNALLPSDIAICDAELAADDFDPRRDARSRVYEYRILNRELRSAFDYRHAWLVREPLDLGALNEAARAFIGEHDFAAFRSIGSDETTTIRRVHSSCWSREGDRLIYRVEAQSFLRHMVRTMVGAMAEAGRGRIAAGDVAKLLESRDRALVPAAAPPCGLFLVEVRY